MNRRLATLDRMLDDLKSTVHTDDEDRRTPVGVRSSSRSSSRAGSIGRRGGSLGADGVTDGGRLTHYRKEYTSPDHSVRTVADTYQYDSGDTNPSGNFQKKVVKSTYSSYKVDGGLSSELEALKRGPSDLEMERALTQESRNILNSSHVSTTHSNSNSKVIDASQEVARQLAGALSCIGRDGRPLTNGHAEDDIIINDEKGGEVRRIVWRNRYEKTYETNDSIGPTVTIEKDAKNRRYLTDTSEPTTISSLTRAHVPPQISPGGQSWADPIPLPTPPQVSPKDPGVAYIYNYGSSGGSAVQPLPPLNYVTMPPHEAGAHSPTPSALTTGQPVIYHYSYHYTIQPGQSLPEGAHPPSSPPALQIVSPPATGYSSQTTNATNVNNSVKSTDVISEVHQNTNREVHTNSRDAHHSTNREVHQSTNREVQHSTNREIHHHTNREVHHDTNREVHHDTTTNTSDNRPRDREPVDPHYYPRDGKPNNYPDDGKPGPNSINYSVNSTTYHTESHHHPFPTLPSDKHRDPPSRDLSSGLPNDSNRNITININKSTTHTSHSTSTRDGGYPPNDSNVPLTSTPYRGGSRSPERRHPSEPRYPSGPSDSLERVRRLPQPGLPFPDTSPVRPHGDVRIPRKVDELMTDFPQKNGGPYGVGYHANADSEPLLSGSDSRRTRQEITIPPPERNEINTISPSRIREEREKTKNQSGPPVYYPPGHEAFSESMHTMTLKEGGRRGKAKWRAEAASGYKESSSSSETKGGVKMVPICLPLCCGAACTIM